jgi:hypothetical protein
MQRFLSIAAMLLAAASLSVSVSAADQDGKSVEKKPRAKRQKKESLHDQFTDQGYGVAGCGLGSIVFGPKPGMIQVIAATVNGTAGSQTFGISSGTSNCDIPQMGMEAAAYLEVNREVASREAARGEGETLDNLATIFKCSDFTAFRSQMKSNYDKVFHPENDSYEASRAIMNEIKTNSQLSNTCAQLDS